MLNDIVTDERPRVVYLMSRESVSLFEDSKKSVDFNAKLLVKCANVM